MRKKGMLANLTAYLYNLEGKYTLLYGRSQPQTGYSKIGEGTAIAAFGADEGDVYKKRQKKDTDRNPQLAY